DLSLLVRAGDSRARHNARTDIQHVYHRRDFLRSIRLPTPPGPCGLAARVLDLLRVCVSHEKYTRPDLSAEPLRLDVDLLSRSAPAFPKTFPLDIHFGFPGVARAVVRRDRKTFPRISQAAHNRGMARSLAFVFECCRPR